MKKILISLLCIFGTMPVALAVINTSFPTEPTTGVEITRDRYTRLGKCVIQHGSGTNDDTLYHNNTCSSGDAYIADNNGSETFYKNEIVCLLGDSCVESIPYKNTCYKASTVNADDEWLTNDIKISKCTDSQWVLPVSSTNKISVFVNKNDKVIRDEEDTQYPVSLVFEGNSRYVGFRPDDIETINNAIKCFAYVCPNGTYGCPDGSCPEAGTDCDTPSPTPDPTPTDPDDGDDHTTPEIKTDVHHMNTVEPYMDALKKCTGN
jgi:hypothetical protein